jgi:phosphocarrier protein
VISRRVTIINKLGLHARAASKLVSCASAFASEVWLRRSGREINGKSIMGVLTLAAGEGTELEVRVDGPDEGVAMATLEQLIESRFGEEQ